MVVIRAIKIEDSIMIKLPSTLGVKEGEEFFLIKKDNGSITLIPKVEDHFADVHDEEYYMPEEDVGFSPSKGYEIKKRRPALVMGRDEYNRSINMVIVCPITMTSKNHPFLVPIRSEKLPEKSKSKVNTNQVYSLDYTEAANRKIQFVENMEEEFYQIAQKFMHNFAFKL